MKALLLDVGSTFVKYAVCTDTQDAYVLQDKLPFPSPLTEEPFTVARAEIDTVIRAILAVGMENGCDSVWISVQMHGYLLRDRGGAFSDYFSWRSGGGDTESTALCAIDFSARGTRLKPNLPIAKLYPIRDALCGTELFTLGSYIAYLLTGNNIAHKTDICATGFFAADTLLPDTASFSGLVLPKVAETVSLCGSYCGMRVYTPVGDHAASVYGSGAQMDTYVFNVGTTSQIAFVGEGGAPAAAWEPRPYFEQGKTLFTLGNLFYGLYGDTDRYLAEAMRVIDSLPHRARVLLGGGGAAELADRLQALLLERGIQCVPIGCDIGIGGLARLARQNRPRVGSMLSEVAFSNMPLLLKKAGLDFLLVDNEHGAFDYAFLSKLFTVSRLAGLQTVVRLPDNGRAWITKCVDAGADGFLLPMTNTAADIARVVEYAKYAPIGKRGVSTMRAHTLYDPPAIDEYMPSANARIKVYAQIETAAGVANVKDILAVNGVDGAFIGPNDLSADLGCIGDTAPILACMESVAAAARSVGKPWGIITTSSVLLEKAKALAVDMISYGSELHMLDAECKKIRKMFR